MGGRWFLPVVVGLAVALVALEASAQQNFFNVPSATPTYASRAFGQVQISATPGEAQTNTVLELGLTDWVEIGANFNNVPLFREQHLSSGEPALVATMFNTIFYFMASKNLGVQVGGQLGSGQRPGEVYVPVLYSWTAMRYDASFGAIVVGGYAGNHAALGLGPSTGLLVGTEIPLIKNKLHFQGDWVIGKNDVSVATAGVAFLIGHNLQLGAGFQVPSPGTNNPFGAAFSITIVPNAADEKCLGPAWADLDESQAP